MYQQHQNYPSMSMLPPHNEVESLHNPSFSAQYQTHQSCVNIMNQIRNLFTLHISQQNLLVQSLNSQLGAATSYLNFLQARFNTILNGYSHEWLSQANMFNANFTSQMFQNQYPLPQISGPAHIPVQYPDNNLHDNNPVFFEIQNHQNNHNNNNNNISISNITNNPGNLPYPLTFNPGTFKNNPNSFFAMSPNYIGSPPQVTNADASVIMNSNNFCSTETTPVSNSVSNTTSSSTTTSSSEDIANIKKYLLNVREIADTELKTTFFKLFPIILPIQIFGLVNLDEGPNNNNTLMKGTVLNVTAELEFTVKDNISGKVYANLSSWLHAYNCTNTTIEPMKHFCFVNNNFISNALTQYSVFFILKQVYPLFQRKQAKLVLGNIPKMFIDYQSQQQ